jgi:hypothetical protein
MAAYYSRPQLRMILGRQVGNKWHPQGSAVRASFGQATDDTVRRGWEKISFVPPAPVVNNKGNSLQRGAPAPFYIKARAWAG